jgi:hypothetical protein
MATSPNQPAEDSIIAEALALIDPSGTLVPGTGGYKRINALIRCWIDQCGPDYALCMAKASAKHLDRWRKFL